MYRRATTVLALVIFGGILLARPMSAQEAKTHTVVRGETLWDLARTYYDNPFQWRRIFEANQDKIDNPHWIYPGQVLTIPGAQGEAQVTGMEVQTPQPAMPDAPCPGAGDRTVFYQGQNPESGACPAGPPQDRTIFYGQEEGEMGGGVLSAKDRPWMAVPMDIFYSAAWLLPVDLKGEPPHMARIQEFRKEGSDINSRTTAQPYERILLQPEGGETPAPGDLLQTFRVTRKMKAGRVATPTGLLSVAAVTDSGVVAVVSNEYARVKLDDLVRAAPPYDMEPGHGAEPVENGPQGEILGFEREHEVEGLGEVGFVSLGSADGLQVGDELEALTRKEAGWTDDVVGRLQVILVQEHTASFRIVQVASPAFRTGTRVRVSGRLP